MLLFQFLLCDSFSTTHIHLCIKIFTQTVPEIQIQLLHFHILFQYVPTPTMHVKQPNGNILYVKFQFQLHEKSHTIFLHAMPIL